MRDIGSRLRELVGRALRDESGQGMVEYGLIIALVVIVAAAAAALVGPKVKNMFTRVGNCLDNPSAC